MCTPGNFGNEWKTQEKVLLALILEFPPNLANHDQVVHWLDHFSALPGRRFTFLSPLST